MTEPEPDSSESTQLQIERRLNLDLPEDRQELIAACEGIPVLRALAEEYLDDFVKWFKAPDWHTVYSGGMINGPQPRGRHPRWGSRIEHLLQVTAKLQLLQAFPGFEKLISGLGNPTQIDATIFEIDVATWCVNCRHHEGITFSPEVAKHASLKHPDFLWHTAFGNLYCECKKLNMWQRNETHHASTLMSKTAEAMGDPQLWPRDVRMEVLIHGNFRGGSEAQLKAVVDQQASEVRRGLRPEPFQDPTFTVAVRKRDAAPFSVPDSISMYQVQVGNVPIQLNDFHNAHLLVTKSIGLARAQALRDFVKRAKKQLPAEGPGGLFVEMPSGIDMATAKLEEMLGRGAHDAVVWASIWSGGMPVRTVWRTNQLFDGRLTERIAGL